MKKALLPRHHHLLWSLAIVHVLIDALLDPRPTAPAPGAAGTGPRRREPPAPDAHPTTDDAATTAAVQAHRSAQLKAEVLRLHEEGMHLGQ